MDHPPNREQAQQRIDRIHAFQKEMATLKSPMEFLKYHKRLTFPETKSLSDLEPRYQVTLNYGRRYEPWIADVKKLQ